VSSGNDNMGVGINAGYNITTGSENTTIGYAAANAMTIDSNNVAIGSFALGALGTVAGSNNNNFALGYNCLSSMQTGTANVAIGSAAGLNITTGNCNSVILIGQSAGRTLGSGGSPVNHDIMIGDSAGYYISNGSTNCTWIGSYSGQPGDWSNTLCLSAGNELILDFNFLSNGGITYPALSLNAPFGPASFHIYNNTDIPAANYERVLLDWHNTSNVFRIKSEKGGTGTVRLIAIDGFAKAGAPAATDLPSGSYAVIDDTTNNQTWLCFNKAGTIRKVQLT
jgi:hypothetical protein